MLFMLLFAEPAMGWAERFPQITIPLAALYFVWKDVERSDLDFRRTKPLSIFGDGGAAADREKSRQRGL